MKLSITEQRECSVCFADGVEYTEYHWKSVISFSHKLCFCLFLTINRKERKNTGAGCVFNFFFKYPHKPLMDKMFGVGVRLLKGPIVKINNENLPTLSAVSCEANDSKFTNNQKT